MRLRCLVLAILASVGTEAIAQISITPVTADSSFRTLTVTGVGEATAVSDQAVLRVSFETDGETVDEALQRHQEEVERVQALLDDNRIPEDKVFIDRASVGETTGDYGGPPETDGFTASRMLTVHIDDLDRVPRLMADLVKDSGDDLLSVQRRTVNVNYVLQNREPLRADALRQAVQDASERAALIAEMAGLELGRVVMVNEAGVQSALFGMSGGNEQLMMEMISAGGGGGEHRVQAGVVVTFVLK